MVSFISFPTISGVVPADAHHQRVGVHQRVPGPASRLGGGPHPAELLLGVLHRGERHVELVGVAGGQLRGALGAVPADQLEKTVTTKLKEQVGAAPKSVDCPASGLKAEVGAKATCTLTAPNGDKVKVYLTATDVNGNNVNFTFKVGTQVEKAST